MTVDEALAHADDGHADPLVGPHTAEAMAVLAAEVRRCRPVCARVESLTVRFDEHFDEFVVEVGGEVAWHAITLLEHLRATDDREET